MKKLKTLGMIVAAAGILGFTAPAFAEKKYNVPTYDKNKASKIVLYTEMTLAGPQAVVEEALEEGRKYTKKTYYLFDRDKDGNVDLLRLEVDQPALKVKDLKGALDVMEQQYGKEMLEQAYGKDYRKIISEMEVQSAQKQAFLAIDDKFRGGYDGFIERVLSDVQNEKGEPFADGKWDKEEYVSPKVESFFPQSL